MQTLVKFATCPRGIFQVHQTRLYHSESNLSKCFILNSNTVAERHILRLFDKPDFQLLYQISIVQRVENQQQMIPVGGPLIRNYVSRSDTAQWQIPLLLRVYRFGIRFVAGDCRRNVRGIIFCQ